MEGNDDQLCVCVVYLFIYFCITPDVKKTDNHSPAPTYNQFLHKYDTPSHSFTSDNNDTPSHSFTSDNNDTPSHPFTPDNNDRHSLSPPPHTVTTLPLTPSPHTMNRTRCMTYCDVKTCTETGPPPPPPTLLPNLSLQTHYRKRDHGNRVASQESARDNLKETLKRFFFFPVPKA